MVACSGNNDVREKAAAAIQQPAATKTPNYQHKNIADKLIVSGQELKGKKGDNLCMNITVLDCEGILSMQYSLKWDPKLLTFQHVTDFRLAYLTDKNFGTNRTKDGILTSLWYDESLNGITLDDGDPIYQICFQLVGDAGQAATIEFKDQPTPFEVVNVNEKVIPLEGRAGKITIE